MPLYVGYALRDMKVFLRNEKNIELSKKDMFCINRSYTRIVRNMMRDHVPYSIIMEVLQFLDFFQGKYEERYLNSLKGYYRLKYIDPFLEGYYDYKMDELECMDYCKKLIGRLKKGSGDQVIQINTGRL